MNEDTYYTVLSVSDTATMAEIKTAYRTLIKQVHPDTVSSASAYLKGLAEEKTRELNEAYAVLSDGAKRKQYDSLLEEHRRQSQPPPASSGSATRSTHSGTSPRGSTSSTASAAPPSSSPPHQPTWTRPPRAEGPLKRWARKHPANGRLLAVVLVIWFVLVILGVFDSSASKPGSATNGSSVNTTPTGSNTPIDTISSSEGVCSERPVDSLPGTYIGTVHNQTANLTASFGTLLDQGTGGSLAGCTVIKPPLIGSGFLHGEFHGTHVEFDVNKVHFKGEARCGKFDGSFTAPKEDGAQEVGDFHLIRQVGTDSGYRCQAGILTEAPSIPAVAPVAPASLDENLSPENRVETSHPNSTTGYAEVTSYSNLEKRCSFMPVDSTGKCYAATIAELKTGDRVKILSPETRAEDGEDIRKIRTEQGWEGWILSRAIKVELH